MPLREPLVISQILDISENILFLSSFLLIRKAASSLIRMDTLSKIRNVDDQQHHSLSVYIYLEKV